MRGWKLPRLSRGGKIVRNLALALGLLVLFWGMYGFPIYSPRLEFRRGERENLIGGSEILGTFRTQNDRRWTIGVQGDQVLLRRTYGGYGSGFQVWPRNPEGAVLVPLPDYSPFPKEAAVAAADVPEGTASARLEVHVGCWHDGEDLRQSQHITAWPEDFRPEDFRPEVTPLRWERTYTAEGELLRGGAVLFRVVCPDEYTDPDVNIATVERTAMEKLARWDTYYRKAKYRSIDCRMEAVFFDGAGDELGRAVLSTPEGGETDASR